MVHQWLYHMVFMCKELDSEIIFEVCCSGKKSIFHMYRKYQFFPIHVVQKNFLSIFSAWDPEIRDPGPR